MRWYDDLIGAGWPQGGEWLEAGEGILEEGGSQGTRRQGFGDLGHTLIRMRVG